MNWTDYKIIFMGTPEFAAVPLKALKNEGFNICLAVTQPDRKQGRGKKLLPPPVKTEALNLGIEVFQPEKIKEKSAIEKIESLNPDFLVVAAYGQILPKKLLDIPRLAPVNIHASILPFYRGASPIQHAVLNMEKETGITTMFMDEGLDTGDILHVQKTAINPDETAGTLHDRLSQLGAEAIIYTLKNFETIKRQKQDSSISTYAPLLKKNDGHINWKEPADKIDAKMLARMGVERKLLQWNPCSVFFRDLRFLTRERLSLIQDRTRAKNQLHALQHSNKPQKKTIERLTTKIAFYDEQIEEVEQDIKQLIESDKILSEKTKRVLTIPGVRLTTLAPIIAETNGFAAIQNIKQLTSYAGYDIRIRESGKWKGHNKISKKGNSYIRASLFFPACTAAEHNKPLKQSYKRIKEKKKIPMVANTAVQRKLLALIYTLWENDTEFDENYQVKNKIA